jgi:PAS domain S-box-containing protein
LDANSAALACLGTAREAALGRRLWDVLTSATSPEFAASLRAATENATSGASRTLDGPMRAPDGSHRTIEWVVRPLLNDHGAVLAILIDGRDVTDHRHAEHEANLLVRLALAVAHTDSIELALSATLRTLCEAAGWVLGETWLPERSPTGELRLVRAAVWSKRDPRLDAFAAQGVGFSFALGEGLPGAAWLRREPVWDRRLGDSTDFTRAPLAAAAGIKAATAIPVLDGGTVVAVMSLYMSDTRIDDGRLIRVSNAVVSQMGPIIQRKQAEEWSRASEARLTGIVSIAVDAIVSIDHTRRITLFNWGAERIFGYAADEMIGQSVDILLPASIRDRHASHINQFAASSQTARRMGERSTIVGQRKNGEIFPAEASISRFRAGGQWTFTVILRDITDRQRTEEGLRFLADAGTLLGDLIHDPSALQRVAERSVPTLGDVCIIDLADNTQLATAAVAATDAATSTAVRAARDQTPLRWDQPSTVVDAMRQRATTFVTDADAPPARAAAHGDKFGAVVPTSLLVIPLVVRDRVLGALTFGMTSSGRRHDASYRTLAEQLAVHVALAVDGQLLYQHTRQAVGARDEILAVVSHDLQNPLSAIRMCASVLREEPAPAPDTAAELLDSIQDSADWMSHIIHDLLDVASIDAGRLSIKPQPTRLRAVLQHAQTMFARVAEERGLTLDIDPKADAAQAEVQVDEDRIVQVMANLLQNACKFTPAGGTVRATTTLLPGAVQVAISDTVPGIALDEINKVFDRFWHAERTSKIRSTGLGLAIARGIIEAHQGRIWVESKLGHGSTFFFTVPTSVP